MTRILGLTFVVIAMICSVSQSFPVERMRRQNDTHFRTAKAALSTVGGVAAPSINFTSNISFELMKNKSSDIIELYTKLAEFVEVHMTANQVLGEEENQTIHQKALNVIVAKAIKQACTALQVEFQADVREPQLNCSSLSELREQTAGLLLRRSSDSLLQAISEYIPQNANLGRCEWVQSNLSSNSEHVAPYIAQKLGCRKS